MKSNQQNHRENYENQGCCGEQTSHKRAPNETTEVNFTPMSTPTLTLSPSNQAVPASARDAEITIISNLPSAWTVTNWPTWLSITPTSGVGNGSLTIWVQANTTPSQRIGTITVQGGGLLRTAHITQAAASFLTLTPGNPNISAAAQSAEVTVSSNTSWTVIDHSTWATVTPNNGSGNGSLNVWINANTLPSSRPTTITVQGGGITRTATITQAAATPASFLTLTPGNPNISAAAQNAEVTVSSNVSWTVTNQPTWADATPNNGSGNGSLNVWINANPMSIPRDTTITVQGGGITRTATITQAAAHTTPTPFLTLSPGSQNILAGARDLDITVSTNLPSSWTVTNWPAWMTVTPTSGTGNGSLTIWVQANTVTSQRTGIITVQGGGLTGSATVIQAAAAAPAPILNLTPASQNISAATQGAEINVSSNISWLVTNSPTWMTVTPTSGSGSGNLAIWAQANTTYIQRTGTITVQGGGLTRTASIIQAAAPPAPHLLLSHTEWNLGPGGANEIIEVASNVSWSVSSNQWWLTASPAGGVNHGFITVTAQPNMSGSRNGIITVTGSGITRQFFVNQDWGTNINVSRPQWNPLSIASNRHFNVITNAAWWSVSSDQPWLTVSPAHGGHTVNGFTISAGANSGPFRDGTVTVWDEEMLDYATVTVRQAGHSPNIDEVALGYFHGHDEWDAHRPITRIDECGAVIDIVPGGFRLGTVGWGTPDDVIAVILSGLGVTPTDTANFGTPEQINRTHETNVRVIAASHTTAGRYHSFRDELNAYIAANNLNHHINPLRIAGLVHCHPSGSHFSYPDRYFSEFFDVPVYVARSVTGNNLNPFTEFRRYDWRNHSTHPNGVVLATRT